MALPELAKLAALPPTISRNNAFLVAVGIVEAGQRKVITPLGKGLARALDHNIADEVSILFVPMVAGLYVRRVRTTEVLAAVAAGVAALVALQLVSMAAAWAICRRR